MRSLKRREPGPDECEEFVYREHSYGDSTCGRKSVGLDPNGKRECKLHQNARLKREARAVERQERWDREKREREKRRRIAKRLAAVGVAVEAHYGSLTIADDQAIKLAERLERTDG